MKNEILEAFEKATQAKAVQTWMAPYTPPANPGEHQFVLFLKPEATAVQDGVNLEAVLDLVFEHLDTFGVTLHAARALPAAYLDQHAIMDQHYGVINRISKLGLEALSDDALNKLNEVFAKDVSEGARIMGGHQFLKAQPEFSALALSTLNDNIGTTKLAGGSYAMRLNVLGRIYILLNPFHAYQLVPFTSSGRAVLVFECRSSRDWSDLRNQLTGATNPAKAAPGSIRADLLANKDRLGMKEVNQGANGVHLSAGPLEGMVELQRFFTDHDSGKAIDWEYTAFGALLLRKISKDDLVRLAQNPDLEVDGKKVSAFDCTEELNADEAAERLV